MTLNEELKMLLEQRGERYVENGFGITWRYLSDPHTATESMDGTLIVTGLTPKQAIAATLEPTITGETSDGYHTFNELYHHRAVLFSVIVRDHVDLAWKSKAHNDGSMYDGMFIVGIETSAGQATYHYNIDPYWDMFDCEELERAPKWDGHTPDDAIARIATLGAGTCHMEQTGHVKVAGVDYYDDDYECSECGGELFEGYNFCPFCGARVMDE